MNSVISVAYVSPPITTTAIGCIISAPMPVPNAIVDIPRIVVSAVIRIGRRRTLPVSISASRFDIPPMRIWFTLSTNTMPLLTMTPDSTRKPTIATIERSIPVSSSAASPPVNASGSVNITMIGDLNDWNCATMIRKIRTIAMPSTNTISLIMPVTVSFSPASSIS